MVQCVNGAVLDRIRNSVNPLRKQCLDSVHLEGSSPWFVGTRAHIRSQTSSLVTYCGIGMRCCPVTAPAEVEVFGSRKNLV